ncbi:phosphoribosyltransferase [Fodinibius sp.]|uniref:phosphoribosyltransferase n=1 Tax=Fodinibius sp. TaxID=1872440 RepID=UPI002ACE004F|nr:phosphoribosyltransferase [Fodinibius sp.]MDZ7657697.1 phosphoribosyltransferase [Fodinibius sp.]
MKKDFTARIVGLAEVYEMAYKVSKKITESTLNVDAIVGIARGGFPPARLVCDFLNIKTLTAIQIRHYTPGGKAKEEVEITDPIDIDLKGKNVLVVDDVNDSGKTLKVAVDHIKTKGVATVKTAVLHEKENTSLSADFVGAYQTEWKWLIYQWAVTEDLLEFLKKDEMLSADKEEMLQHLSDKYDLDVQKELLDKVLAMKSNYPEN